MKYNSLLFTLLLGTAMISSCKKKDAEIHPEKIYSGASLSCLVEGSFLKRTEIEAEYYLGGQFLAIRARDSLITIPGDIHMSLNNVTGEVIIPITEFRPLLSIEVENNWKTFYRGFSGEVEITYFDTTQKIVSGKFKGEMVKFGYNVFGDIIPLGDTITIDSGRFDASFIIQ